MAETNHCWSHWWRLFMRNCSSIWQVFYSSGDGLMQKMRQPFLLKYCASLTMKAEAGYFHLFLQWRILPVPTGNVVTEMSSGQDFERIFPGPHMLFCLFHLILTENTDDISEVHNTWYAGIRLSEFAKMLPVFRCRILAVFTEKQHIASVSERLKLQFIPGYSMLNYDVIYI